MGNGGMFRGPVTGTAAGGRGGGGGGLLQSPNRPRGVAGPVQPQGQHLTQANKTDTTRPQGFGVTQGGGGRGTSSPGSSVAGPQAKAGKVAVSGTASSSSSSPTAGPGAGVEAESGGGGAGAVLSCLPCEKEFTSEGAKQAHLQSHVLCPEEGCGFSALRKVVNNHHEAKHGQFSGSGFQARTRTAVEVHCIFFRPLYPKPLPILNSSNSTQKRVSSCKSVKELHRIPHLN